MKIYIDEAGGFVGLPAGDPRFSLVFAIVVPSSLEAALLDEFSGLIGRWPSQGTEIKGSELNESQTAALIDLVSGYDVFASFFAIDMTTHPGNVVDDLKARQAKAVTASLTPAHHPPIVAQFEELASAIRRMPNQLFLQAFLMIELVLKVVRDSTLYYVQRMPEELGSIGWTIDRKDRTITEMESTWSTLVLPMSETDFARKPLVCLKGADYSHLDARYGIRPDDLEAGQHQQWIREVYGSSDAGQGTALNVSLMLSEQRDFADSASSLGLQLADMLATALRRALNNRLQSRGWARFGHLLIAENSSPILQLGPPSGKQQLLTGQHIEEVWQALKSGNKGMLVKKKADEI